MIFNSNGGTVVDINKGNVEDKFNIAEEFWRKILDEEITDNSLSDSLVENVKDYDSEFFEFDEQISNKIMKIGKGNDLASYVIFLAAYNILLYRYSNVNNNAIVSPVIEKNANGYNKYVVFREEIKSQGSFKELLVRLKTQVVEGYKNQFYPIRKILEQKEEEFLDGMFHFVLVYDKIHNYDSIKSILSEYNNEIILSISEEDSNFKVKVEYKKGLIDHEKIKSMINAFHLILKQVTENIDIRICDINVISENEENKIRYLFNDTKNNDYMNKDIVTVFEEVVQKNPDHTCLTFIKKIEEQFEYSSITYKQINDKSNQVANLLLDMGVKSNDIVALLMTSSIEMYIGILGVLKAGAAYLPLAPNYPIERIEYSVLDSDCNIMLTNVDQFNVQIKNVNIVNINLINLDHYSTTNLKQLISMDDTAYVIYTSGTTGKPKGVLIDEKNMMNTLWFRKKLHDLSEKDVIFQLNTYIFDGFVATFFTPLISGSEIVIIEEENITDISTLKEVISNKKVTHFASIPLLYKEMIDNIESDEFASVKSVVLAGDKVRHDIIKASQEKYKNTKVIIEYGVSECAVLSTYMECPDDIENKFLIGRPIDNNQVYVVNNDGLLQPIGIVGELCISGIGVSCKGYLNNQELTNEKFVENPFHKESKLYKTGDLVRWLQNGTLEYIGRKDNQVKIRGYRIELGEIENQLLKHPNINNVIVTTKKISEKQNNEEFDRYICAYYILNEEAESVDTKEFKVFLNGKIPEYMIPTFFIQINQIPLTANNKIDYHELPTPDFNKGQTIEYPTNEEEKKLALIWSEILGIDVNIINLDTKFFDFGGHSLNVTKLLARIYKEFGLKISINDIYEKSTIREIAQMINENTEKTSIHLTKLDEKEFYKVSSVQKRMYFLNELDQTGTAYHITTVKKLTGNVDLLRIEDAFIKLIKNYEILRTSFHNIDGEILQKPHKLDSIEFHVDFIDDSDLSEIEIHKKIDHLVEPFDLSKPQLIKVNIIKSNENEYYMIINLHHIIADGFSIQILLQEFKKAYNGERLNIEEYQYKDFSSWQYDNKDRLLKQKNYWVNRFAGEIPVLNLPTDYIRPSVKEFKGDIYPFTLSQDRIQTLKEIAEQYNTSMFMVILAVYNIFLHKISNQCEIVVGVPTLGRKYEEFQNMIGMFANTLPLKNSIQGNELFHEFLMKVKENVVADLENEEYQYEDLINHLQLNRTLNTNPLFDTMLNYEDIDMPSIEMDHIKISDYDYVRSTSKFDLTLNCVDVSNAMRFEFEYDIKLFKRESMMKFAQYFEKIIEEICDHNSNITIDNIKILKEEEYEYIFHSFNATNSEYEKDKTVVDLFVEQCNLHEDKIALRLADEVMTYKQLNERSNQLADKLTKDGFKKGNMIGIMLNRSFELVVSILAVLKIGAVYIPIGKEYDRNKIEYVMSNRQLDGMLLDKQSYEENAFIGELINQNSLLFVDDFMKSDRKHYIKEFESKGKPNDSAYIIYTSGSTGVPKGVEITNQSLTNYISFAKKNYIRDGVKDFALFTSISFDLTITSIFTPLISGTTVVIYNENDVVANLKSIVKDKNVQIVKLTPSHLKFLNDLDLKESVIRRLILGGENLTTKLADETYKKFNNKVDIINEYGPTEATVGCMIYHYNPITDYKELSVPIGKPADNVKIYVLDKNLNIVPKGVKGEMFISGDALAKGYINDNQMTNEKFIPNPYQEGQVMYKTGDIVVMNENGDLVFVDRNDRQVKINGYRIDLCEVEKVLLAHDGVEDAVVLTNEKYNEKYMIAFLVLNGEMNEHDIKKSMYTKLPQYMHPEKVVVVDRIPVNKNGKIDSNYLLQEYVDLIEIQNDRDDLGSEEEQLLHIWRQVLDKNEIHINDNFFEAGGTSMKALKVKSLLEETYHKEISVTVIFEYPTIRLLAEYLKNRTNNEEFEGENDKEESNEIEEELSLLEANMNEFMGEDDE